MQNPNRRPNQLEERIIAFAASVVSLSSKLPRNPQGRHICDQILRSGSAVAANYGEARAAESRSDFIHKLKIVSKELNEATKRLSGSRSSWKVPSFLRTPWSRSSWKTANFLGLFQRRYERLARAALLVDCWLLCV